MSTFHLEPWLTLRLALLFVARLLKLSQFPRTSPSPQPAQRRPRRPLRPRTPDDCPCCRETSGSPALPKPVAPYAQRKSPRGRKKTIDTQSYSCPHPDCDYFLNTDAAVHPAPLRFGDYSALIGYGHHGRHEPIQDFFCTACQRKFTAARRPWTIR